MLLIYYTRYSIEFHCYKLLMSVGFNSLSGQGCTHWPVGKIAIGFCRRVTGERAKIAEGQEVR